MVTKLGRLGSLSRILRPGRGRVLLSSSATDQLDQKLLQYTRVSPTPISIAEFLERGEPSKTSEAASYRHLVHECLVRLSHMITEVEQLFVKTRTSP